MEFHKQYKVNDVFSIINNNNVDWADWDKLSQFPWNAIVNKKEQSLFQYIICHSNINSYNNKIHLFDNAKKNKDLFFNLIHNGLIDLSHQDKNKKDTLMYLIHNSHVKETITQEDLMIYIDHAESPIMVYANESDYHSLNSIINKTKINSVINKTKINHNIMNQIVQSFDYDTRIQVNAQTHDTCAPLMVLKHAYPVDSDLFEEIWDYTFGANAWQNKNFKSTVNIQSHALYYIINNFINTEPENLADKKMDGFNNINHSMYAKIKDLVQNNHKVFIDINNQNCDYPMPGCFLSTYSFLPNTNVAIDILNTLIDGGLDLNQITSNTLFHPLPQKQQFNIKRHIAFKKSEKENQMIKKDLNQNHSSQKHYKQHSFL